MNLELSKINNVHFVGIGGIGISAVARMMKAMGKSVTGQDMQDGEIVKELQKLGIEINIGHQSYENIPKDTGLVVYTVAIETYDKELFDKLKSQDKFIIKSYPEMLGVISEDKYTIAVCGTHGKTTTTGMIKEIFVNNGNDPTVIVGSLLKDKDGSRTNFIHGNLNFTDLQGRDYFIVEACEYRRSFLNINPDIVVITNIDNDHLDYYKDIEDIKSAFREFILKVPEDGFVVCNIDDENIKDVVNKIKAKVINWGEYFDGGLELKIPGIHNKKNAAAAVAAAANCGINKDNAKNFVKEFPGTWKRFEFKGKLPSGVLVYDDYAHHPTEITSTLEGFREKYPKTEGWNITVIFQPHLFSRTKLLLNDFAQSFYDADQVIILPIYYAREIDDSTISEKILSNEINKYTNNSKAFTSFELAENHLGAELLNMDGKDIIITMGAGEASKIGDFLLKM
jgi:UDP-N-acetylmuramate--alanine ligase